MKKLCVNFVRQMEQYNLKKMKRLPIAICIPGKKTCGSSCPARGIEISQMCPYHNSSRPKLDHGIIN